MKNSYFSNSNPEQSLVDDLTIESIKMHGEDMIYVPRTLVNEDKLFGEDTVSKFENGHSIEMYIESVDGFEGEGDLISRFGLEIRDSVNLIVSKTILHEGKETGGHNHKGQEEVYIFTEGSGVMQIDDEKFLVTKGDIVLIPDGAFHKVYNTSNYKANNPLIFVCVFDGGRNH